MTIPAQQVKERPILFSAPMVRAILDGRKTQTRRILKGAWHEEGGYLQSDPEGSDGEWWFSCSKVPASFVTHCPFGVVGDRIWVRETWRTVNDPATCIGDALDIDYKADGTERIGDRIGTLKWKPSIFMPRWASRITLEITGVRVERLQEITEIDVEAEGFVKDERSLWQPNGSTNPIYAYELLWDLLNGKKHPWGSNPWVWVISFRKL